jgi:hypothetical protein
MQHQSASPSLAPVSLDLRPQFAEANSSTTPPRIELPGQVPELPEARLAADVVHAFLLLSF